MSRIHVMRLASDEEDLRAFLARGGDRYAAVDDTEGRPPATYLMRLLVPGVERTARGRRVPEGRQRQGPFIVRGEHRVRLSLPHEYPFRPPQVTFLDPILHPNVYPNGRLCWGLADDATWWRGGDGLGTLVERLLHVVIGRPECTNPRSPANPVAVDSYIRHADLFPLMHLVLPGNGHPPCLRFFEADP